MTNRGMAPTNTPDIEDGGYSQYFLTAIRDMHASSLFSLEYNIIVHTIDAWNSSHMMCAFTFSRCSAIVGQVLSRRRVLWLIRAAVSSSAILPYLASGAENGSWLMPK